MAHDLATQYPELAASGRLQMYSYGAPRVGNTAFRGRVMVVEEAESMPPCFAVCAGGPLLFTLHA